ncbi:DUF881 domain-containing protein [Xylanimonas ulmi]|uniref:Uncharacterized protein YlxW (UPF0749 family) n=1 Tax=Xylanimonas ulmi TaxID=228973 RepID=A0A4Q7M409_9MICO|nr:DUF881 domain-containing protein [Xylanibacterium ulmi]RZS62666.1 uncharacterized protein YlxW (UPF0749 family) [Xylanibacterium ulmi]
MTRRAHVRLALLPGAGARLRPTLTVGAVAALAGVLFAASAQLAHGDSGMRTPSNLAELVEAETSRVDDLSAHAEHLRAEVDQMSAATADGPVERPDVAQREGMAAGTVAVTGTGLRVELDDAPASSATIPGMTPDDLVVHQQDIQHVINALWAGGAEAMTLQGERVTMTSAFRCSGNILLLHGRVFSPPYVIQAVGSPARLRAALDASPGLAVYRQYVQAVGLGWSVRTEDKLELPAYTGSADLRYARLPDGTDPLR